MGRIPCQWQHAIYHNYFSKSHLAAWLLYTKQNSFWWNSLSAMTFYFPKTVAENCFYRNWTITVCSKKELVLCISVITELIPVNTMVLWYHEVERCNWPDSHLWSSNFWHRPNVFTSRNPGNIVFYYSWVTMTKGEAPAILNNRKHGSTGRRTRQKKPWSSSKGIVRGPSKSVMSNNLREPTVGMIRSLYERHHLQHFASQGYTLDVFSWGKYCGPWLVENATCYAIHNVYFPPPFTAETAVRQGCSSWWW